MNDKLLNKIIKAAYGKAGIISRITIYFYSFRYNSIKELYDEYKVTADEIHSINGYKCPEHIIKAANNTIKNQDEHKPSFVLFTGKPLLVVTSFLIIITAGLLLLLKPHHEQNYSKVQIETAENQAKQSLVFVGRILNKTKNTLTGDIMDKQVAPPIHRSLETVNNLLKGS
jgi:hypothetical protein